MSTESDDKKQSLGAQGDGTAQRLDHAGYGKSVMRAVAGTQFVDGGLSVRVDYGRGSAQIDGVVSDVAVELESRNWPQLRTACQNLARHPCPKKLLVLMYQRARRCADSCRALLSQSLATEDFRVVELMGWGGHPDTGDSEIVRKALSELGWKPATGTALSNAGRPSSVS